MERALRIDGRLRRLAAALAAVGSVACSASHGDAEAGADSGVSDTGPPVDAGAPLDAGLDASPDVDGLHAWLAEYHAAACAKLRGCVGWETPPAEVTLALDPAGCGAARYPSDDVLLTDVARGRRTFDPVAAARCLESVNGGTCAHPMYRWITSATMTACADDSVAPPTSVGPALGEPCWEGECAPGLDCWGGCNETCVAPVALGDPCEPSVTRCADPGPGMYAQCEGTPVPLCIAHMRPPVSPLGGPCGGIASQFCEPGLWCISTLTGQTCMLPLRDGDRCPDQQYDSPLCPTASACVPTAADSMVYECAPVEVVRTEGATCQPWFEHGAPVLCDELAGFVCGTDLRCHHVGAGADGDVCDYVLWPCGAPRECDTTDHCRTPGAVGAPCVWSEDCVSRSCTASGTCVACA